MGRRKIDRTDKVIQSFESSKYLKIRLKKIAKTKGITVSALIRNILESYLQERSI